MSHKTYDLSLSAGGRRLVWRNDNHGISLDGETLRWTIDGAAQARKLADIAAVNLQSGGSWQNAVRQCRIAFADGTGLTVSDADALGFPQEARTAIYRDFVRDLHGALAGRDSGAVRYRAGYGDTRFRVAVGSAVVLGLLLLGVPAWLFFMTLTCTPAPITCDALFCTPARACPSTVQVFAVLAVALAFLWPLARLVKANAPRTYVPEAPPEELMG